MKSPCPCAVMETLSYQSGLISSIHSQYGVKISTYGNGLSSPADILPSTAEAIVVRVRGSYRVGPRTKSNQSLTQHPYIAQQRLD